jgi:signal transduction histidine kinase
VQQEHVGELRSDEGDFSDEEPTCEQRPLREEEFAAITHDLRNPLSVITLEVSVLEEKLPPLGKDARDALLRIGRNLTYLDNLLQDLLDLSAIDAARFELHRERLELCSLVTEVVERMVSSRDKSRVQVRFDRVIDVKADGHRIARVVANLVHNALKYSARDTPVSVVVEQRAGRAVVSVIDEGAGLAPDEAHQVFEKFRRAASAKGQDGVGLGLYVSRRIVEAHDGKIGVDSTFGRGSRFYFELPIEDWPSDDPRRTT